MKKKNIAFLLVVLLFSIVSNAQEKYTLSGTISEATSNESLIGVTILVPALNTGTVTNEYGFYSITLPEGEYEIIISYLGFEEIRTTVSLQENIKKEYQLTETAEQLEEVVITGDTEQLNIRKPEMSVNKLSIKTIKKIPVVLGETDIIKSVLLLPGVTSAGEGASGFNVRGGAADQNLILLDEATIFNASHLFGLFSVFNPDAIKDLKLYKGGIPARYGGRVASVLEMYQKDGNSKNFSMNGGIGAVASRILAEGPVIKGKGSFLIGGRSSYAHLFLKLANNDNSAYFYDLNTKLSYKLNAKNSLFLSGYFGRDVFDIADSFTNSYGNAVLNLRWNHLFSDKLFSNLSLIYSDYYYGLTLDFIGFEWNSGIRNFNLKYDFKYYASDRFQFNYGLNTIYYKFNPGEIEPNSPDSGINYDKLIDKYANEAAIYADAEHQLSDALSVSYGVRLSQFNRLGQREVNSYQNNTPVTFNEELQIYEGADPIAVTPVSRGETLKKFFNIEPRAALSYAMNENTSIKVSYNRMTQYLHLITNTSSPTPLDVWAPSGTFIQPQILDQVALGYYKSFRNNDYTLETEAFYKIIQNRIDYIDGADLIANDAIERIILNGEARAYGLEILFKKNNGNLNGWISYTLSRSEQRTPGRTPDEPGINNGAWYSTPYDKTHDLSFTGNYSINEKWTFGANLIFQTGQPTTFPNGQYQYEDITVPSFSLRNQNRLPAYHRMDIAATYTPDPEKPKRWKSEWVFSIYNVYNRKNAAAINFRENRNTGTNEAVRLSIFGIIPSVTYNFKF